MPKTYEYNGEQFSYDDMIEAYGDDRGINDAVKEHGIKEIDTDTGITIDPGKKKATVQKGASAVVKKDTASNLGKSFSVSKKPSNGLYPWSSKALTPQLQADKKLEEDVLKQKKEKKLRVNEIGQQINAERVKSRNDIVTGLGGTALEPMPEVKPVTMLSEEWDKQQKQKDLTSKQQQKELEYDQAKHDAMYSKFALNKNAIHDKYIEATKITPDFEVELEKNIQHQIKNDGTTVYRESSPVAPVGYVGPTGSNTAIYTAFEPQIIDITEKLRKQGVLNKYSKEKIKEFAIDQYRKDKIAEEINRKTEDFYSNISSEDKTFLEDYNAKQVKFKHLNLEKKSKINETIGSNIKSLKPKLDNIVKELNVYGEKPEFKTQEELDIFKQKRDEYLNLYKEATHYEYTYKKNLKELDASKLDLDTAENEFDIAQRHYGWTNVPLTIGKDIKAFIVGGLGIASLVRDTGTALPRLALSAATGEKFEFSTGMSKDIAAYQQESSEFWEKYLPRETEIHDAGSFFHHGFNLVSSQLPMLVLAYLSGGSSLAAEGVAAEGVAAEGVAAEGLAAKGAAMTGEGIVAADAAAEVSATSFKKALNWTKDKLSLDPNLQAIGLQSAGSKYLEEVQTNETGETNYNALQMVSSSLLWGYAEALGEKVTVDILHGSGRTMESILKGDAKFIEKLKIHKLADWFGHKSVDMLNENLSEQFTNVVQNSLDKFVLGKDVGILDNTGQVFKDTTLLTTFMMAAPHVAGLAIKPFLPIDEAGAVKENSFQLAKYMQLLKNPNLSVQERVLYDQKIKDLTAKSSSIMNKLIKRVGDMPTSTYDKIMNVSRELGELKQKANEIFQSDSENKEEVIKALKEEYDTKKRDLNKTLAETKVLSSIKGTYTIQEKRDLYDLHVQAEQLKQDMMGKTDVETIEKKELLKQVQEKSKNIVLNNLISTQAKGIETVNEILKAKGINGAEVINAETVDDAIKQHDVIVDKLLESGEITDKKAASYKQAFLQTIENSEAAKTNIENTDYIFNIKDRINGESVFSHEPGHVIFDRLISEHPEDYKEIHDALLDHVEKIFGESKNENEQQALQYIRNGVAAYKEHARQTNQNYAYDELLQVVGDAIQNYGIGMESMDKNFLQSLGEKIKDFIKKVLKISNPDSVIKLNTGQDVYNFIKDYRRTFRKGELSNKLKATLERGKIEGRLIKKEANKPKKPIIKSKIEIQSKNPLELKRKGLILDDFINNRLNALLISKEIGEKADTILLNKIKGFFNSSKSALKYGNIDTTELENYTFDLAKQIRDKSFTNKEIQTELVQPFTLDISTTRLKDISDKDIESKIEEIKSGKVEDVDLDEMSEEDITNLAVEMASADAVFSSGYVLNENSRKGKKIGKNAVKEDIKAFNDNLKRLTYLLGEKFHNTKLLRTVVTNNSTLYNGKKYDEFMSNAKFKKIINDKRLKSIENYKPVAIEPMKNSIGNVISDFYRRKTNISNLDIWTKASSLAFQEVRSNENQKVNEFSKKQVERLNIRREELVKEITENNQAPSSSTITHAEKVELGRKIKEELNKTLNKTREDAIKDSGSYLFETLFNAYVESEDQQDYLRFISTLMSMMSSNMRGISRQQAFPKFFSMTPGNFIKKTKKGDKVQEFHYEHPEKSITFLNSMLDAIKYSNDINEFRSNYEDIVKNYHGFVMNKNDQQVFDKNGYTKYSPEYKGNELPIADYSYKVNKDYDVLYIEPSGNIVSLDDYYRTEIFKKELIDSVEQYKNESINVKASLKIVSKYIEENKSIRLSTEISNDLLDQLDKGIEDYWGKLSDENVGLMYQNIEYAKDIIEDRALEDDPIMRALNEDLNLEVVKSTETRINNIINGVNVKASLAFDRLNLQNEKRKLITVNTEIASRYRSGQTKSEKDQAIITKNIERVKVINDLLEKPEGEAIAGVSEKNQKISEKSNALMRMFKDPNTNERTKDKLKMDILENNMGIIVRLVKKYWSYNQQETAFTAQDLKEELILQFFDMLRTYNPDKNNNFGAYLNGYLPKRIPRILEKIGTIRTKAGEERVYGNELSDEGSKQLSADETAEFDDNIGKRKVALVDALKIPSDIMEEIKASAIRALGGRIPGVASKDFKLQLQQNIRTDLRNVLLREFGIKFEYVDYINQNWKTLYDAIPLTTLIKRFNYFAEPVLDSKGKQKRETRSQDGNGNGKGIYRKKQTTNEEFFGYFLGQNVGLTTRSTRKTALLDTINEELAYDVIIDLFSNDKEFREKFEEKQEMLGNTLAENYLSEIAKQLDRETPIVKASLWAKDFLEINNLSTREGISILEDIASKIGNPIKSDSVFDTYIKNNPLFKDFINYFRSKVQPYIDQAKLYFEKKKATIENKELLAKSKTISNEEIKGLNGDQVVQKLIELDDKAREDYVVKPSLSSRFNLILQQKKGVRFNKKYSEQAGYVEGRDKGKWKFFIPANTEDFTGLLYSFLPYGQEGEEAMNFFNDNLIQPFAFGMHQFDKEKNQMIKDYNAVKQMFRITNKLLQSRVPGSHYTVDQAIRLYLWKRQGEDIKGVSNKDLSVLMKYVKDNLEIKNYAEELSKVTKRHGGYVEFEPDWIGGTISTDILNYLNKDRRAYNLTFWRVGVDEIFSDDNLNKIQALYGLNFRRSLENCIGRMKSGKNITPGAEAETNRWMEWVNGANASIMFLNTRSALLQLVAVTNYIDMDLNNPLKAGMALANIPQFVKDVKMLWNDDYLVDRRGGLRFDVSADAIASAAAGKNGFKKLIGELSEFGFKPTVIADSISCAIGGASYYRNHFDHYVNIGYTESYAHKQAILDWSEKTEESQQSARPDKISKAQSTSIGRLVFAFGNTSMQYNRLMKRAFLDLANKRGDWKANVGKIVYYGAIQNIIFTAMQNALFASMFGDDDDDKTIFEDQQLAASIDGLLDTILRGSGFMGAILSTGKNMLEKYYEMEMSGRKDPYQVPLESLSISPALSSKMNKMVSAGRTFIYKQEKDKMKTAGFSLDNPAWGASAKIVSTMVNLPLDRLLQKIENLRLASDNNLQTWQRLALIAGYNKYNLNIKEPAPVVDVLSESDRAEFEQLKKIEPKLTEKDYMEMKNLEPKKAPEKKNKKTWLNIFNPIPEPKKDILTKDQRKKFNNYKQIEPKLTEKEFIDMMGIKIKKQEEE